MQGAGVLGVVLAEAVHTQKCGSACTLADVGGFTDLADLATPVVESSLESWRCHAYYDLLTIQPASESPFHTAYTSCLIGPKQPNVFIST